MDNTLDYIEVNTGPGTVAVGIPHGAYVTVALFPDDERSGSEEPVELSAWVTANLIARGIQTEPHTTGGHHRLGSVCFPEGVRARLGPVELTTHQIQELLVAGLRAGVHAVLDELDARVEAGSSSPLARA